MGLTVIQKSDKASRQKAPRRVALVLAGGAISGGAFKLGGLVALNSYLENRKVTDFDMYVGCSAGAFLSAPISAGIPPEELIRSLHGTSPIITQFRPWHFYYPNFEEYVSKPAQLGRDAVGLVPSLGRSVFRMMKDPDGRARIRRLMMDPSYPNLERVVGPLIRDTVGRTDLNRATSLSYLPNGVFDNSPLEAFIRKNLRRNRLPNNFRLLHLERKNSLYISATNLNTANTVLFGHDEDTTATISEAVSASSAIPGFFKPVKIGTEEYVDGSVRRTANIFRAVEKGADLVIAYNPFRPFVNVYDPRPGSSYRPMGSMGPAVILDQVARTMLYSRLHLGLKNLRSNPSFKGDLLLIEPTESDSLMFNINPLAFWKRAMAAEAGYLSVKETLERHHRKLSEMMGWYGIQTNLRRLKEDESALRAARHVDDEVFEVLEQSLEEERPNRRLYVVS